MDKSKYPNLSWLPKPTDWPDDFDGAVTAQTDDGTYAVRPISQRTPGSTQATWWNTEAFVATFEPRAGHVVTLTPVPTTRGEAASAVKAHQQRTCDEREERNQQ